MDIKKDVITFFRRKKKVSTEKPAGNVSMKDGDHGTIFGINRKIVIGIGILFFTTFALAFIFASSDTKKQDAQPKQTKQEVADQKSKDTSKLPGDYADLVNSDTNSAKKKGIVAASNTGQVNAAGTTAATRQENTTVPQIPGNTANYSRQYTLPYQNAVSSQVATDETAGTAGGNEVRTKVENIKDQFKSAIAFALGNDSGIGTEKATANSQVTANTTPISSISYIAPVTNGLQAGTLIPVILCSGINTDVGGQVIAQVESDIYDSTYGSELLIPAGSRLVGSYDAGKASTDGRVSVSFTTIVLPNGGSYSLGDNAMVAVDGAGYMGISGRVNNHTGRTLGAGALSTALAAVAGVAGGNTSSTTSTYNAGQLAAQGAMSNLLNTASSLFQKGMNTQATVTVEPGYEFNIYITKGISFASY